MCMIVGAMHPLIPHDRIFLRNVFDEPVGDLGECTDPSIGFTLRADQCEDLGGVLQAVERTTSGASGVSASLGLATVAFLLTFMG
jgi:hypothetical protein